MLALAEDTSDGHAAILVVVVRRVHVRGVEVEVEGVRGIIDGRRPVAALTALTVQAIVVVAAIDS